MTDRHCPRIDQHPRQLLAGGFLIASLSILPLWAQDPERPPRAAALPSNTASLARRWAVVIGVTTYLDQGILAYEYGVPDARLVYTVLVERAGYDADRVLLIADDQPKAHLRPLGVNLRTQVASWLKRASKEDTVLVFYAGRAAVDQSGRAFLIPQECERIRPRETSLAIESLRDMLAECPARSKLVLLAASSASQQVAESLQSVDGLVALASCHKGEKSMVWSHKKQTVFSTYVAQGLSGKADADGDSMVDSQELCRYVVKQVQATGAKGLVSQTPLEVSGKGVMVVPVATVTSAEGIQKPRHREDVDLPSRTPEKCIINSLGMKLVLIPPGEFMMGSPESEIGHEKDESPLHKVKISKPFYMGVYEVVRGEYAKVMKGDPEFDAATKGDVSEYTRTGSVRLPVADATWDDASTFCRRLSAMTEEKRAGRRYRLPTEAEWEYACRAGTSTPFNFGSEPTHEQFNGAGCYGNWTPRGRGPERVLPVGTYPPNAFGLHDMHGNVAEWCQDLYDYEYYAKSPTVDPLRGPPKGATAQVLRGGSFCAPGANLDRDTHAGRCRSASRSKGPFHGFAHRWSDKYGFRVILDAD